MPKLSKEQIESIKKLSNEGKRQFEIVKELNIPQTIVNYWVSSRERQINYSKNRVKSLSKKERQEIYKRQYPYRKKYFMERYKNDEEFRNKVKERMKLYQRRRRNGN